MIVVKLMGGLGNQMFQYAAGRALSIKHGVQLLLDETFLKSDPKGAYTPRAPELHQLKISARVADLRTLKEFGHDSFFGKFFRRKSPAFDVLFEGDGLNNGFFKAGSSVYLDGFWQSEEYFMSSRKELLNEFRPDYDLNITAAEYLVRIKEINSVSLHVRRGDYVSHSGANKFHGVVGEDYYLDAIKFITQQTVNCHFFIFSDDITWCKKHLAGLEEVTFVESNSDFSFTDLYLMKHCKHHIIANSSYSWWGAWLCEERGSFTVAPRRWLNEQNSSIEKVYCKNWIRI